MKYFVLKGRNNPGYWNCEFNFFDIIEITEDVFKSTRKHAYRTFYEMGANPRTMRKETSFFNKSLPFEKSNEKFFCKNAIVWEHTHTFLIYVPISEFSKFEVK